MKITSENFGKTKDGQKVSRIKLENKDGSFATILDYGATIDAIVVPDKNGNLIDVSLGYSTIGQYETEKAYFGSTVGRCANRIAGGRFTLSGKEYKLAVNNGENHLHGGIKAFDKKVFDYKIEDDSVLFTLLSPDGDEGYPGNLSVGVRFSFSKEHELKIEYHAQSDQDTPINLTNHAYFNLNGEGSGDILGHSMKIYAPEFTPINKNMIPTGEIAKVAGTPLDFTEAKEIGRDIEAADEQLQYGFGYDHNFVLGDDGAMKLCAETVGEKSGIKMKTLTTKPAVQLYCGNMMEKSVGKSGKSYDKRHGFCLETQYYPNSVNQANFPSSILKKGETYNSTTIYAFSV